MIKEEIFNILRQKYNLRVVISDKIGTRIVNVERWVQRKSVPKWYHDQFVNIIESELHISKNEIEC